MVNASRLKLRQGCLDGCKVKCSSVAHVALCAVDLRFFCILPQSSAVEHLGSLVTNRTPVGPAVPMQHAGVHICTHNYVYECMHAMFHGMTVEKEVAGLPLDHL